MNRCPIEGCPRSPKPGQLMCWPHWRRVPRALNKAIFETCAHGPRRAYLANRAEAIRVVNAKEAQDVIGEATADLRDTLKPQGHYGPMCMDPDLCAGKGYCPRDPNCAD